MKGTIFLNLHDIVKLLLVDVPVGVAEYLRFEWGMFEEPHINSEATISVKFVPEIRTRFSEYVGHHAAHDGKYFYIMDESGRKMRIRPYDLGLDSMEILCEDKFNSKIINDVLLMETSWRILNSGAAFIHSSAFSLNGKGVIMPAWAHTGKTSSLLRFLIDGASYVSDDLTIVHKDGTMLAFPRPLQLFGYNLDEFPQFWSMMPRDKVKEFSFYLQAASFLGTIAPHLPSKRLRDIIKKEFLSIKDRLESSSFRVPYKNLFPEGKVQRSCLITHTFFLVRGDNFGVEVFPCEPEEIAFRAAYCHEHELRAAYLDIYDRFSFAFPQSNRPESPEIRQAESKILKEALHNSSTYMIRIPRIRSSVETHRVIKERIS